jgi:hypothetical protein
MNTWTPLWSKIVDSSLWVEPYYVRVLFLTMMALKDRDDVVRYSAFALAKRANMSEQEVLDGLEILSEPDRKRIEPQANEGRRIEKVADGWLVLNGAYYRKLIKREYNARKQRDYRESKKNANKPLAGEQRHVQAINGGGTAVEPEDLVR